MAPGAPGSTGPLTKGDLDQLPSKDAYDTLAIQESVATAYTPAEPIKIKLEGILTAHLNTTACAKKIAAAWYHISAVMGQLDTFYKDRCEYFHYWLGDLISSQLKERGTTFSTAMSAIYEELRKLDVQNKCTKIGEDIDKGTFHQMRKMYEYYRDYQTIREQLQRSGSQCDTVYDKHLQAILTAYGAAQNKCNAVGTTFGPYCKHFQDMFQKQYYRDLLLPEKRKVVTVPEPPLLGAVTRDGRQQPDDDYNCLDQLPSESTYNILYNVSEQCNDGYVSTMGATRTALKGTLNNVGISENYADQIINTWCYANGSGKGMFTGERCPFLYYWMGDVLPLVSEHAQYFSELMKAIYQNLQEFKIDGGCTDKYPDISRDTFISMKSVFDYTQDYTHIMKYVPGSSISKPTCTDVYNAHLDRIAIAFSDMSKKCRDGSENNEQWCQDFKDMAAKHSLQELLQLKCSLKHTEECPTNNTVAGAISGTLFTAIGLPVIAYALYKYNLLPSWISDSFRMNKTGGRNRRGRRKRISTERHQFDVFTEGSSTYGSTTAAPSTIADSTDDFTIYNRSPPPKRQSNNRQEQQRRTNISYHPT